MTDITKISRLNDLRNIGDAKARADIADSFNTSTTYAVGDLVLYDGLLYRFTSAHAAGAWNSSHVVATTIGEQIEDSGWRTLCTSPITIYYRKCANVVNIVSGGNTSSNGDYTYGYLPVGYRPKVTTWYTQSSEAWSCAVNPDSGAVTSHLASGSGTCWFAMNFTYFAA